MNKTAIKSFAVSARRKLIDGIKQKAYEIGVSESEIREPQIISSDAVRINNIQLKKHEINQRVKLIEKIREKGYEQVIEKAAYIWFNRLTAIRFMEVNGYLPTGVRVLSSSHHDKKEPDIIKEAMNIDLGLDEEIIYSFQDAHDTGGLFKYLLVKQCNALHDIMPVVFEEIADYTEILLPDHLLQEGSVIRELVESIEEDDWREQVEIIGWLYQYYISEKKDEVFEGLKKNIRVAKENIPAATQLFTPDWIVKYMVENSLGRLWLESHPNEELKGKWKFYLDEAEQEIKVQEQLQEIRDKNSIESPEDIRFLDPCMGSGHILVYAYDVLYDIYKSEGYSERDIPKLILEKNLYGLEIDDRAAQLAYFAVMMKARCTNRRIFKEKIELNLCSIQESSGFPREALELIKKSGAKGPGGGLNREDIEYLLDIFKDAKEYGSILDIKPMDFGNLKVWTEDIINGDAGDIFELHYKNAWREKILPLIKQAEIMSSKYDVVCTNPPYMGIRNMNPNLSGYVSQLFPDSKYDLFSVMLERNYSFCRKYGFVSMITQNSWMFLMSFEDLRKKVFKQFIMDNMLHLGYGTFGADFGTTAFVIRLISCVKYRGAYIRLADYRNIDEKLLHFYDKENYYYTPIETYLDLPRVPVSYWISGRFLDVFRKGMALQDMAVPRQGMATSDNDRFVRMWFEVPFEKIGIGFGSSEEAAASRKKWFPFNKGGDYRKWYGNNEYVVNWENDGQEVKEYAAKLYKSYTRTIKSISYYFKRGATWNAITSSSSLSVRYFGEGFIFSNAGMAVFDSGKNSDFNVILCCAYLNSKVIDKLLGYISPTLNFNQGDIARIPILTDSAKSIQLEEICSENILISKQDWDSYEFSWDFRTHPMLKFKVNRISEAFMLWAEFCGAQFNKLKSNEEEINKILIDLYNLYGELDSGVIDSEITVRRADKAYDIKSFVSYAVGCMFGRYSPDEEGLIYAGGKFDRYRYKSLKVSEDNIIPVLDDEYFEDDIVNRFIDFVGVTFGQDNLEENLDYIAEALGRKSAETSRQAIRRYFLKDFYKDHVSVYQKRPVYWLFDSGKNDGFKALVYMHRYDIGTSAAVRTDYLHKLQRKYEAEVSRLDIVINSAASEREKASARKRKEKIEKQMQECREYDQLIAHAANQKIALDLDDGVKANYAKFQGIKIPLGEGRKPLSADLLAKI